MPSVADRKSRKSQGIHYTPKKLADFLALRLWINAEPEQADSEPIQILDPACGDGALLAAIAERASGKPLVLTGFETDRVAARKAQENLCSFSNCQTEIRNENFLDHANSQSAAKFGIVITNPPYVRTQVLGRRKSQNLANVFGLTGRVDLYHAFLAAITRLVKENGWIGTLTSNRFMYVQSGKSTRRLLHDNYDIAELYDLGDTKLFDAAVLPAVLIGRKSREQRDYTRFVRVQQIGPEPDRDETTDLFECFKTMKSHESKSVVGQYEFESGRLMADGQQRFWRLESRESKAWLDRVAAGQQMSIGDIAEVKVGIKTTADQVFIRDDWGQLAADQQPEEQLLRPLINHQVAARWKCDQPKMQVLYPYELQDKRTPVDLRLFPKAKAYLESHHARLGGRQYLMDAGRKWFEIWVPHRATDWQQPKIVWPDISETPRFFLDCSGAIVNGDCYWIKLKPGQDLELMYLILAVANSRLAVQYYDYCFHNRLYGRRRRFMTQYVKQFPMPNPESRNARQCIESVKQLLAMDSSDQDMAATVDDLVDQAFGLTTSAEASTSWP